MVFDTKFLKDMIRDFTITVSKIAVIKMIEKEALRVKANKKTDKELLEAFKLPMKVKNITVDRDKRRIVIEF
jgi:hypothetical protein